MSYNAPIFAPMKNLLVFLFVVLSLPWTACTRPDGIYEKDIPLPSQQWAGSFRPAFTFNISEKDTAYLYNVYIVIRHTDAYNYNNIWIRGSIRQPGDSVVRKTSGAAGRAMERCSITIRSSFARSTPRL